jgi:hypothetical protein
MKQEDIYKIIREKHKRYEIKYFFKSEGLKTLVKVVEYSYLSKLNGYSLFNLAFGDYDEQNDQLIDDTISDNGDVYKIFNTVLSTVPLFFKARKGVIIMARGSDSKSSYTETCRLTCRKKCVDFCKNAHRRINIYRYYVNKNFNKLIEQFVFLGGHISADGFETIENYELKKRYDSIYLIEKK